MHVMRFILSLSKSVTWFIYLNWINTSKCLQLGLQLRQWRGMAAIYVTKIQKWKPDRLIATRFSSKRAWIWIIFADTWIYIHIWYLLVGFWQVLFVITLVVIYVWINMIIFKFLFDCWWFVVIEARSKHCINRFYMIQPGNNR